MLGADLVAAQAQGRRRRPGERDAEPLQEGGDGHLGAGLGAEPLEQVEHGVRAAVAQLVEQRAGVVVDAELSDVEPGGGEDLDGVGDGVEDVVFGLGVRVVGREDGLVVQDEDAGGHGSVWAPAYRARGATMSPLSSARAGRGS